ncbi:MAG TPA: DUF4232 domain-containing protein [Jatrophihabitans sp.]
MAGVLFTNTSSTTCTVSGYPFAQLTYRGGPLGKPAKDDPGTVRTIKLRPNKSAQSQLTAVTTCQSPISDHVVVKVPGTAQSMSVAMQLRGCSLSIDPLEVG